MNTLFFSLFELNLFIACFFSFLFFLIVLFFFYFLKVYFSKLIFFYFLCFKVTRGWLVRKRFKKLQQEHQMKQIFNQISIKSQNLIAKLNYQRSFEIETSELYKRNNVQVVVQNEPSESIEVESQMKSFTAHDERAQIKAKPQMKKSNLKQQQQLNNLNSKMNQQMSENESQQNW